MAYLHSDSWINSTRFNKLFCSPLTGHTYVREELIGAVVSFRLARISPISFTTGSFILGLIILIILLAFCPKQPIMIYIGFMLLVYAYHLLWQVRSLVNLKHASTKIHVIEKTLFHPIIR